MSCPVCLDTLDRNDCDTMCMPVCRHRIHVTCGLAAAQYDIRCPVCRTQDPSIESRHARDPDLVQLQEIARQEHIIARRYQQRRSYAIRKRTPLKKLRDRIKNEAKFLDEKEKQLERAWLQRQREAWMHDLEITKLKHERRKHQQHVSTLQRRLSLQLKTLIGDPPYSMLQYSVEQQ